MRRIVSCYFAGPGTGDKWIRMARVFDYSARTQCPNWKASVRKLTTMPYHPTVNQNHIANTAKLDHWCDAVKGAADGDELLLIDVDMMIVRPIDDAFGQPFDIAYTLRPPDYPHPINGGVVFVRVSPASRAFMERWRASNEAMLLSRPLRDQFRKYAGLNQRAFGMMLENGDAQGCALVALPCLEWNCEDSTWSAFSATATRIVHIKSALRNAVFAPAIPPGHRYLRPLARRWHELEQEARAVERASPRRV